MKEKDMQNPNHLGHFHRDIVRVLLTVKNPYYVKVLMCNHTKEMSKAAYKKYKDHATLCLTCSHIDDYII